jgi:Protein of unknown function (DUF3667)
MTEPHACLNCEAPFGGATPRFCPACGQETNVRPPRLGEFLQQFGGAYLATEGALWRTLKLLLTRPGELTAQYLAGRRKHYVLPLRLYLTISVLVLLAMRALTAMTLEDVKPDNVVQDAPTSLTINLGNGRAGLKDGAFFCENLPAWVCRRLERRLDFDPRSMVRQVRELSDRFVGNLGAAMFLLLPAFAAGLLLVYRNRRLHYTEHLVFALHVHAFWFVMFAVTLVGLSWVKAAALVAIPVYTMRAMRRVYGGRFWPRLARASLLAVLYGAVMAFALTAVALWSLLA